MNKQTASNNEALRHLKKTVNAPIYKKASEILNEQGHNAMVAYLSTHSHSAFGLKVDA